MPCSGCGKKQRAPVHTAYSSTAFSQGQSARQVAMERAQDKDFVRVKFTINKRGKQPVVGGVTQMRYGYHQQGDTFTMHVRDVYIDGSPASKLRSSDFTPIREERKIEVQQVHAETKPKAMSAPRPLPNVEVKPEPEQSQPEPKRTPLPEPEPIQEDEIDLQLLPGIGATTAQRLNEQGINSAQDLIALGVEGLSEVKGIGRTKAEMILDILNKMLEVDE